jgi:hypothetical protein
MGHQSLILALNNDHRVVFNDVLPLLSRSNRTGSDGLTSTTVTTSIP